MQFPKLAAPRLWPTWCLIGLGWLSARLPLSLLFPLGKHLGQLAFCIGGARRSIAQTNLRLCFPELGPDEARDLARRTFEAVTLGALELCVAWLNPKRDLRRRIEVRGAEHFRAAAAKGRGVLLLGAHFAVLDLIAQALADQGRIDVMYRKNRNPAWEWLQVHGRRHYFQSVIERKDARAALRSLGAGRAVWYAADQDYGAKHSVFAPFFGIEAATIRAARFARFNNSPAIMLSMRRHYRERRWTMTFSPVIEQFPTGDERADATRINGLIEAQIRTCPEQYLWLHRRFKTRPPGMPNPYA